jgi:predicted nucleic acid-binding protein
MVKALFDTNVLVDYLNLVAQAEVELDRYDEKAISTITWIEVMVGAVPAKETATRSFLDDFEIIRMDDAIAEEAVILRRRHRLKLSDAIIWASARTQSMLLITRNTKDFPPNEPGIRLPYKI